jgi:hypothetical protein
MLNCMKWKRLLILIGIFSLIIAVLKNSSFFTAEEIAAPEIKISFPRLLRVNEINFYQIESNNLKLTDKNLFLRLYNPTYKKSDYVFSINGNTSIKSDEKEFWKIRGYFFLPNIIPSGKAKLQLRSGQSVIYQSEVSLLPEIVFHSPLFQQGFPPLSVEAETGMKEIIAQSYPVSRICFNNPTKKSFFFFSVKLKDNAKYKKLMLRIYIKQRILDEIMVNTVKKEYVYCFAKNFMGDIDWLKVRFETFTTDGKPITFRENIYEFEYFSLLPFNGIPNWINSFLKSTDFIEDKFRCRQD